MKLNNLDYATSYLNTNCHDEQNVGVFLDLPYLKMLRQVLDYGIPEMDRTGTGTRSIFGLSARYDLRDRFPLFTHKKMHFRGIAEELLWMLNGYTNAKPLEDRGITIWAEWGNQETRELGPVYGDGFREFKVPPKGSMPGSVFCEEQSNTSDQLKTLLTGLLENPGSRRHLLTLWNPHTVGDCALPPCHGIAIHFKRQTDRLGVERLHCCMYQRSCDMLLGVPYNVASYSLLTCLIAAWLRIQPGFFIHTLGDAHIYHNHVEQVREILDRTLIESPSLAVAWPGIVSFKHDISQEDFFKIKKEIDEQLRSASLGKMVLSQGEFDSPSVEGFLDTIAKWPGGASTTWGLWRPTEEDQSLKQVYKSPTILDLRDYDPHPAVKAPVAV